MKTHVADFGTDMSSGGLPHEKEMVCVVAAWKQANVMAGTELRTDALAKVHGHPVTMLPCDSTSIMTEFKTRYGKQIPEEKLPARSYFEHNSERLADGALKAEPLAFVVSAFEESKKTEPTREYGINLDSKLTMSAKCLSRERRADGPEDTSRKVLHHDQNVASHKTSSARTLYLQRLWPTFWRRPWIRRTSISAKKSTASFF